MASKKILINGTHPEAVRLAYTQDGELTNYEVENLYDVGTNHNIYKGRVSAVETSLECAFVDFGQDRHGMLPFRNNSNRKPNNNRRTLTDSRQRQSINDISVGQIILVQVEKEERGTKGAALTTSISLAGNTVVLKAQTDGYAVSRTLSTKARSKVERMAQQLRVPRGMGIILRTSSEKATPAELQEEIDHLYDIWKSIEEVYDDRKIGAPTLIYSENGLINRLLRDKIQSDIDEVIIDDSDLHDRVKEQTKSFYPGYVKKISKHTSSVPLFDRHEVESKLAAVYDRVVELPSGGTIVIDHAEALVAIDVNSKRANRSDNLSDTALKTNLEATTEIARQLRLRNIGGLIVIDFIDMEPEVQEQVDTQMRVALARDRARTTVVPISELGIMQIQRQRMHKSVIDSDFQTCRECLGFGFTRTAVSTAWQLLHRIESICTAGRYRNIEVKLRQDVLSLFTNSLSSTVKELEEKVKASITFVTSTEHAIDNTTITAYTGDKNDARSRSRVYELSLNQIRKFKPRPGSTRRGPSEQPVLQYETQVLTRQSENVGVFARFLSGLKSLFSSDPKPTKKKAPNKRKGSTARSSNTQSKGQQRKSKSRDERGPRSEQNRSARGAQARRPSPKGNRGSTNDTSEQKRDQRAKSQRSNQNQRNRASQGSRRNDERQGTRENNVAGAGTRNDRKGDSQPNTRKRSDGNSAKAKGTTASRSQSRGRRSKAEQRDKGPEETRQKTVEKAQTDDQPAVEKATSKPEVNPQHTKADPTPSPRTDSGESSKPDLEIVSTSTPENVASDRPAEQSSAADQSVDVVAEKSAEEPKPQRSDRRASNDPRLRRTGTD